MSMVAAWEREWGNRLSQVAARAMEGADPGHGWDHVARVVGNAKEITEREGANPWIVLPAAWLHDCVLLPKNAPHRHEASRLASAKAKEWLQMIEYPSEWHDPIQHAIEAHSFSAGIPCKTLDAQVVQDADRLEALGAIGIARCLQTGAVLRQPLYDPHEPFPFGRTADDRAYSMDHFFVKLLRLPATMQTESGRSMARSRTEVMVTFLRALARELGVSEVTLEELISSCRTQ